MRRGLTGRKKLGQPVPESNLASDAKSSAPQQTQRYTPRAWLFAYLPENGGSVSLRRVTWNWGTVSSFAHSLSVFDTFLRAGGSWAHVRKPRQAGSNVAAAVTAVAISVRRVMAVDPPRPARSR